MPLIKELFDLSGRVAIVTGGSRGLGREIAEGLAEAGAALMLCARRAEWLTPTLQEMRARGFRVEGLVGDVSRPAEVQAVVDGAGAALRKIGNPGHNAGVTGGGNPAAIALQKKRKGDD